MKFKTFVEQKNLTTMVVHILTDNYKTIFGDQYVILGC